MSLLWPTWKFCLLHFSSTPKWTKSSLVIPKEVWYHSCHISKRVLFLEDSFGLSMVMQWRLILSGLNHTCLIYILCSKSYNLCSWEDRIGEKHAERALANGLTCSPMLQLCLLPQFWGWNRKGTWQGQESICRPKSLKSNTYVTICLLAGKKTLCYYK